MVKEIIKKAIVRRLYCNNCDSPMDRVGSDTPNVSIYTYLCKNCGHLIDSAIKFPNIELGDDE